MVLISSLKRQVQQDAQSGRLRVNVRDHEGAYQRKVYVKVIGTANKDFKSGQTDLRGVFEARDVRGVPTAIARKADHYAFYRGTQPLLVPPAKKPQSKRAAAAPAEQMAQQELGNVRRRLKSFQARNDEVWMEQTRTKQQGVQVQKAK